MKRSYNVKKTIDTYNKLEKDTTFLFTLLCGVIFLSFLILEISALKVKSSSFLSDPLFICSFIGTIITTVIFSIFNVIGLYRYAKNYVEYKKRLKKKKNDHLNSG